MQCPKCKGEMWDNRQGKQNPKAPDYKCKNKDCKWQLTKQGEWIASDWPTALWSNQISQIEIGDRQQAPQQFEKELDQSRQDEKWEKISEGKVRHGVSVAFIRNGASASPDNFVLIEKWVRFIMTGEIKVDDSQEPTA